MTLNSSETAQERQQAGHAAKADHYLDSVGSVYDPVCQTLALIAAGYALLALGDTLDDRLADVADAVTGVQDQVGELRDWARPARPWWRRRGRSAARPAIKAADMVLIRQALADAAAWCRIDECSAGADNERLAHAYLALRERLGGAA
jgi:hypothetical protein